MGVDVLRAVAVIAIAAGAVTKLQAGICGVGLAADGALVDIAFFLIGSARGRTLFGISGFDSLFEINGLG